MRHLEGHLDPRTDLEYRLIDYKRLHWGDPRLEYGALKAQATKHYCELREAKEWKQGSYTEEPHYRRALKARMVEAGLTQYERLLVWLRFVHGFTPSDLDDRCAVRAMDRAMNKLRERCE